MKFVQFSPVCVLVVVSDAVVQLSSNSLSDAVSDSVSDGVPGFGVSSFGQVQSAYDAYSDASFYVMSDVPGSLSSKVSSGCGDVVQSVCSVRVCGSVGQACSEAFSDESSYAMVSVADEYDEEVCGQQVCLYQDYFSVQGGDVLAVQYGIQYEVDDYKAVEQVVM